MRGEKARGDMEMGDRIIYVVMKNEGRVANL